MATPNNLFTHMFIHSDNIYVTQGLQKYEQEIMEGLEASQCFYIYKDIPELRK